MPKHADQPTPGQDYDLVGTSEEYHGGKSSKFRTDGEAQKSSKHRADRSYDFFIGIGHTVGSPSSRASAPRATTKAGSLRVSGNPRAHQIGKK